MNPYLFYHFHTTATIQLLIHATFQIPVYYGSEEGMIKEYIWTGQKFHGVDGFNGVFHDRKANINLGLNKGYPSQVPTYPKH